MAMAHVRLIIAPRFLPPSVAEKYQLDLPEYQGVHQIAELGGTAASSRKEDVIGLAERQG